MGLLMPGVVRCNCFAQGLCTRPPFPADQVVVHDGDWDLAEAFRDDDVAEAAFRQWARSSCAHRSMWAANVGPLLCPLLGLLDTLAPIDADWARAIVAVLPQVGRAVVTVPAAASAGLERFGVARSTLTERLRIDLKTGEPRGHAVSEVGWLSGDHTVRASEHHSTRGFEVEERALAPDSFARVLGDLQVLVAVATQTGNPIVWDVGQERPPQWRL